jgi:peptide/nickel transport system permease protein
LVAEAASTDYWLLRQLGYDVLTFNLAHAVFATPAKGGYNLIFHVSLRSEDQLERIKAEINLQDFKLLIPGRVHGILGTDSAGNDVFSQVAYAARMDLAIALLVSLFAVAVGFAIGFVAGYFQGWVDNRIMVFPDVIAVFPVLPLLLILNALQPRNIFSLMLPSLLFLVSFTTTASRNLYLRRPKSQKLKEIGPVGTLTSIAKEFSANLCLTAASAVLFVTAISFVGFDDHSVPSLGKVLNHAFVQGAFESLAWWWFLPPLLGIMLLALGLFLIGYGLDDD